MLGLHIWGICGTVIKREKVWSLKLPFCYKLDKNLENLADNDLTFCHKCLPEYSHSGRNLWLSEWSGSVCPSAQDTGLKFPESGRELGTCSASDAPWGKSMKKYQQQLSYTIIYTCIFLSVILSLNLNWLQLNEHAIFITAYNEYFQFMCAIEWLFRITVPVHGIC